MSSDDLTYAEHGATRGDLPAGWRTAERDEPLGRGPEVFARAVAALMTWEMHRGAGMSVPVTQPPAAPGAEVVARLGPLRIPCRVVYVVDEPDRKGFAYGTLRGHPVSGEEAFVIHRTPGGEVRVTIRAFSRPALWWSRLGGPLGRLGQAYVTGRYVAALRRAVRIRG